MFWWYWFLTIEFLLYKYVLINYIFDCLLPTSWASWRFICKYLVIRLYYSINFTGVNFYLGQLLWFSTLRIMIPRRKTSLISSYFSWRLMTFNSSLSWSVNLIFFLNQLADFHLFHFCVFFLNLTIFYNIKK